VKVGRRDVEDIAENGNPGVVDPGVEPAVDGDGDVGDALDILFVADVGDDVCRFPAGGDDLLGQGLQRLFVSSGNHQRRAALRRHSRGDQADAARCASDDDDLFGKWTQR
jgi:hypothetical protein